MATRPTRGGIDHPTVVPENYDPAEKDGESPDDRSEGGAESGSDGDGSDGDAADRAVRPGGSSTLDERI